MKEGEYGGLYEEEEEKKEEEEEEEEEDSNETEHDKDGDGNEDEAGEEENNDESDEENMENESKFRKPSRQTEYEQRRRKSSTGSHDSDMDSSHLHSPLFARMPEEVVLELKKDYTVRYRAMTRAALSGYVYTLLTAIGAYVKGSANLDEERRELPLHARDLRRVRIYIQQGNRVLEQIFAFVLVWRAVCVCVCVCVCLSVCISSPYFSPIHYPSFTAHSSQLDSTISEDTEPFILVRRHVIILKVVPVRAIILHDRCLLLLPQGADAYLGRIIAKLQPRRDGDTDSSTGEETSKFEFRALEAVLDTAVQEALRVLDGFRGVGTTFPIFLIGKRKRWWRGGMCVCVCVRDKPRILNV